MAVAVVLLMVLAGCAATAETAATSPVPAPSPLSSVSAGVGDEIVLINCAMFVPIQAAADVLGVPVGDVIDQQYPPERTTPTLGAVAEAMSAQAVRASGGHQCRYVLAGAQDDGPSVTVRVLPNAASEFGRIEPDVNDGLNNMMPVSLGDHAFSACRDGEWQGCRAEVLTGTTWLSISVASPAPNPAAFQEYANGVVDSLGALTFAQPSAPARPECAALLSPHDLTGPGALLDPTGSDRLVLDDRAILNTAARVRGGLVDCTWTDAGVPGVTPIDYSSVTLTILPGAAGWGHTPPAEMPSTIVPVPVDLSAEPGAHWPAAGVDALAGCADDQCEVTLLAEGVWLTVTTTGSAGSAGLPGARALAVAAYARYVAAI